MTQRELFVLPILIVLAGAHASARPQDMPRSRPGVNDTPIEASVKACMSAARERAPDGLGNELVAMWGGQLLPLLVPYTGDKDPVVRSHALAMAGKAATSATAEQRAFAVRLLCSGVCDQQDFVRRAALRQLGEFEARDFDADAKKQLTAALTPRPHREVILACGIAETSESRKRLAALAKHLNGAPISKRLFRSVPWAAALALARMGDEEELMRCFSLYERVDTPRGQMLLLDDLQYTRSNAVMFYILAALESQVPAVIVGDAVTPAPAQYACSALAKMLEDFPVKSVDKEPAEFSSAEVEQVRGWTKEQTSWRIRR